MTQKSEVPTVYRALAMSLRGNEHGALFGWVRASDPANKPVLEAARPPKTPCLLIMAPMPQQARDHAMGL